MGRVSGAIGRGGGLDQLSSFFGNKEIESLALLEIGLFDSPPDTVVAVDIVHRLGLEAREDGLGALELCNFFFHKDFMKHLAPQFFVEFLPPEFLPPVG